MSSSFFKLLKKTALFGAAFVFTGACCSGVPRQPQRDVSQGCVFGKRKLDFPVSPASSGVSSQGKGLASA
jgi:hypothetical protein